MTAREFRLLGDLIRRSPDMRMVDARRCRVIGGGVRAVQTQRCELAQVKSTVVETRDR